MLETREIGLAAYMITKGCKMERFTDGTFHLSKGDSDSKSLDEWAVEYSNSCCSAHDQAILTLRNLVRNSRR